MSFLPKQNDVSAPLSNIRGQIKWLAKVKRVNRRPSKLLPVIAVVPVGKRHFQD